MVSLETLRGLVLALPAVEEGKSLGTLGFRVKGIFLAGCATTTVLLC